MFLAHNVEALFSSDSARAGHLETFVHQIINIRHPLPWHSPPGITSRIKSLYSYTNRKALQQVGYRSGWLQALQHNYNATSADSDTVFFYERWKTKFSARYHFLCVHIPHFPVPTSSCLLALTRPDRWCQSTRRSSPGRQLPASGLTPIISPWSNMRTLVIPISDRLPNHDEYLDHKRMPK